MNWIIKSGKKNWSGKEFSNSPAKIYTSFDEAVSALNAYHFWEKNDIGYKYVDKTERLELIPLTESKEKTLLSLGLIRW